MNQGSFIRSLYRSVILLNICITASSKTSEEKRWKQKEKKIRNIIVSNWGNLEIKMPVVQNDMNMKMTTDS